MGSDSAVGRRRVLRATGGALAGAVGAATVGSAAAGNQAVPVTLVEPDDEDEFEYPYFCHAPASTDRDEVPILVEPNNTGGATDDPGPHREIARVLIESSYARTVADRLGVPLLVPVFPRPQSDPVDWTHYTHQLDRDTLAIDGGPLERVDRQLLAMVEHARNGPLSDLPYGIRDRIALDGFSASGNFADRFAVLHAESVLSVTAGGLNGMALLPLVAAEGRDLRYHVGVADVPELTGEQVDLDALDEVNQFLYMGAEDENDTIPYEDAWTDESLRETALAVYGEDMVDDRFPTCQAAYEAAGVSAQFRVYEGVGHAPEPAIDDVVAFHRASMDGGSVEAFGEALAGATIDGAEPPTSGGSSDSGTDAVPGFAVGSALAGITGATQLLRRRSDGEEA